MTIEEKLLFLETAIAETQVTPGDVDTVEKRLTIFARGLHNRSTKWRTADVLDFVLAELARQAEEHARELQEYEDAVAKRLHMRMEDTLEEVSREERHARELDEKNRRIGELKSREFGMHEATKADKARIAELEGHCKHLGALVNESSDKNYGCLEAIAKAERERDEARLSALTWASAHGKLQAEVEANAEAARDLARARELQRLIDQPLSDSDKERYAYKILDAQDELHKLLELS